MQSSGGGVEGSWRREQVQRKDYHGCSYCSFRPPTNRVGDEDIPWPIFGNNATAVGRHFPVYIE